MCACLHIQCLHIETVIDECNGKQPKTQVIWCVSTVRVPTLVDARSNTQKRDGSEHVGVG